MNVAFKHLEAKLRFGELSIGQWAGILGGVLFALVFAQYLSPVRRAAGASCSASTWERSRPARRSLPA